MIQIKKRKLNSCTVAVPGSKSISHRMVVCAALAAGKSTVENLLSCEDTELTMEALTCMGASFKMNNENSHPVHSVYGFNGTPTPFQGEIYLGNSGTSMRLVAGVAALGDSPYHLCGDERMAQRPMDALLSSLAMIGISADSLYGNGCPPVIIKGGERRGGQVTLDCSTSSQYLSALMMIAPFLSSGLDITLVSPPVSSPYIDLTMDVMAKFQVEARRITPVRFEVKGGQTYVPGHFSVEPDLSNASYFWAAGAVTGAPVTVTGSRLDSLQGDLEFVHILERMGCRVMAADMGITVQGGDLRAVEVDMGDCPDVVPTLAVVAAFARGTTRIVNIAHLREKECDRIGAVVSQLSKMGVQADQGSDWLSVTGVDIEEGARVKGSDHDILYGKSCIRGASIETFNDHRIAMAFSVAGLMVDNVIIENESCVNKSFPTYWEVFETLK